jgi:hypothetical protein
MLRTPGTSLEADTKDLSILLPIVNIIPHHAHRHFGAALACHLRFDLIQSETDAGNAVDLEQIVAHLDGPTQVGRLPRGHCGHLENKSEGVGEFEVQALFARSRGSLFSQVPPTYTAPINIVYLNGDPWDPSITPLTPRV